MLYGLWSRMHVMRGHGLVRIAVHVLRKRTNEQGLESLRCVMQDVVSLIVVCTSPKRESEVHAERVGLVGMERTHFCRTGVDVREDASYHNRKRDGTDVGASIVYSRRNYG